MTTAHVTADTLQVRFTRREKIAGLVRDIDLPLAAIRDAQVVPDGLAATHGLRAPGLGLPGYRKIGTWRRPGHRTVVSVSRGRPAVQIAADHPRLDGLLLDVSDPEQLVAAIHGR
ncbi:hypothetical protein [Georgenia soli]|nr:hypothetical protein [Georgenia soli]